jgi:predicted MPP superfamily phosphohydrolase
VPTLIGGVASLVLADDMFGVMRGLSWALFLHTPVLGLGLAVQLRRRGPSTVAALGALGLAAVGVDAFGVEPRALEVSHLEVRSRKLHEPLKVVVLSDIQTDDVGEYEHVALARAAEEHPDLVLLTGDYVQARGAERAGVARAFTDLIRTSGLRPRLGAFAVRGNVDDPDWEDLFAQTAVTAISATRSFDAGPVRLEALSLGDSFDVGLSLPGSAQFQIAFGHGPDFALGDVGADLLIAGHTHGGQVRLPGIGPLLTLSCVPREWAAGATALPGGRTLVVSRGIGMERAQAPRLRFLCRPQVVVIDLRPGD